MNNGMLGQAMLITYADIAKRCGERSLKYDINMMVENYIAEYYKMFTE